jgi:hypothetical protein
MLAKPVKSDRLLEAGSEPDQSELAQFDFSDFSPDAAKEFVKCQAEDVTYRYNAVKRVAQREGLDTVSPKHVRKVFNRGRRVLWAVLHEVMGAAGWALVSIGLAVFVTGDVAKMGFAQSLATALSFALGAVLVSLQIARQIARIKLR